MSYALITGASKGIGKAIAIELAKRKYDILITARSVDLLKQTADEIQKEYAVTVKYLALDLTELYASQKLFEWCLINDFHISILVNNAGFGLSGPFEEPTLKQTSALMQLNMVVPVELCRLFIVLLKKQDQSYILNDASTAAYQAVPGLTIYAASKAFILRFSRGLKWELAKTNISVTCISPGPTDTDWAYTAKVNDKVLKMADKLNMTPEKLATIAVNAMFNKRTEVVAGITNKLGAFAAWLFPDSLIEKTTGKLYK